MKAFESFAWFPRFPNRPPNSAGPTTVPNEAPSSAVAPRPSRGCGHRSRVHEEAAASVARDSHLLVHVDDTHAAHRRPAIEGSAIPRQHLPHRVDRVPARWVGLGGMRWVGLGWGRGMDAQGCPLHLAAQHTTHNTDGAPSVHEDAVEEREALDPRAGDHLG